MSPKEGHCSYRKSVPGFVITALAFPWAIVGNELTFSGFLHAIRLFDDFANRISACKPEHPVGIFATATEVTNRRAEIFVFQTAVFGHLFASSRLFLNPFTAPSVFP